MIISKIISLLDSLRIILTLRPPPHESRVEGTSNKFHPVAWMGLNHLTKFKDKENEDEKPTGHHYTSDLNLGLIILANEDCLFIVEW